MAGTLLRIGDRPNTNICEFCVDTVDEIQLLPTTNKNASGKFENKKETDIRSNIKLLLFISDETAILNAVHRIRTCKSFPTNDFQDRFLTTRTYSITTIK